jgi:hypothetical protein
LPLIIYEKQLTELIGEHVYHYKYSTLIGVAVDDDGNKSLYLVFVGVSFFSQHLVLLLEQLGQQHLGCFFRIAGQQHLECF